MTQENIQDLNRNVLMGYGQVPWHLWGKTTQEVDTYEQALALPEGTFAIYSGAIPQEAVEALMPHYAEKEFFYENGAGEVESDPTKTVTYPMRDGLQIARYPKVIGKDTYAIHQPMDTIIAEAGSPLADQLISAGTLKEGYQVWAQYGNADEVVTPEGVSAMFKLVCATSIGLGSTIFKHCTTLIQCDNTLTWGLGEENDKPEERVRHTSRSSYKVEKAREEFYMTASEQLRALDDYQASALERITSDVQWEVTDKEVEAFFKTQFPQAERFVDEAVPSKTKNQDRKLDGVLSWYNGKFEPYKGTAFGLLQSFDAANRWSFRDKDEGKADLNMQKVISSSWDADLNRARNALIAVS